MKIVYSTTTTEKNYCVDRSKKYHRRVRVGSTECKICEYCHNRNDERSWSKGIVMCADNNSVQLTGTQFRTASTVEV